MITKVVKISKPSQTSNADSLGFGGLLIATDATTELTFDNVERASYINCSDSVAFTTLGFTPTEGTKKDTEVDLVSTGTVTGTVQGGLLLSPVMKVLVDTDTYEIVKGYYTTVQIAAGFISVYGES